MTLDEKVNNIEVALTKVYERSKSNKIRLVEVEAELKEKFKNFNNQNMPIVMLVVGTAINVATNMPNINAAVSMSGMISGLASTGLYEALRNLLDKDGKKED